MQQTTRYARSGDVRIAYQVFGQGPDLVMAPGFVSHIENYWDEPRFARWLNKLASFCRVTIFDKRGTGLSDRVSNLPTMDERADDVRAVMDAVGIDRAAQFGISEGGSLAAFFAASHPERSNSLILYGAFARFSQWLPTDEAFDGFISYIDEHWGSGASLPNFAPSKTEDSALQQWWGKFERLGASPSAAMALMRMNREIDISGILHTVQVPTLVLHLTGDTTISIDGGRELAARIPNATLIEFPGTDHIPFLDAGDLILSEMEEFLTGARSAPVIDRVLATVLFTDIVDSTARAEKMGDRAWRDLLNAHDQAVRQELTRFRGNEVKSLGDGFLATFDGPARAIHCATAIRNTLRKLDVPVRVGVHTGEVEFTENDVRGIAVHIASRVAAVGKANDVVVSRTVKDLVAGSGLAFEEFGSHSLKGVAEEWQLYRASA
ncbi:MAG: adenylate/guanylate cyclase domain-containing protein [Rhizobiales bacterium]|nr:adenylate/guanylate cyclase domain-containing protein [Hyphomicrobiales bacterium]